MGFIGFFLPLLLMFVFFYFLIIKPQNKEKQRLQQLVSELKAGDKVITFSGIIGDVDLVNGNDDFLIIKSEGSRLRIKKEAVSGKLDEY